MTFRASGARRSVAAWGAALSLFSFFVTAPIVAATFSPAQAQRSQMQRQPSFQQMQREPASAQGQHRGAPQSRLQASADFRTALEPHGRWQRHSRWGDVWIPANRPRDWRPYTAGRWVYTNDWGWYWISDDSEARWGWATYHYGRWVLDNDLGWCWVAGDEWGPAWVQWRRGDGDAEYVGWAPLPPDEVVVTYRDEPRFWIFVRGRDFIAPRIASVILPIRQYDVFIRQTVIVNRTVVIRDRFAVNPGIAPNLIAKFSGRPLRTFDVRPVVLAGTAQIPGALQVRAQDVRSSNFRPQTTVRQTQNIVRAADRVQAPQPLAAGERGRLGDNPPRAAQGRPSTTGQAPGAREQQPQQGQQQQPQRQQQGQQPTQQQEGRSKQDPTQGRGGVEQRQQAPTERRGAEQRQQQPGRQAVQPQQAPRTEGRGGTAQRQQAPTERRGAEQREQRQQPSRQVQPQQAPRTEGRGGTAQRQQAPTERRSVEQRDRSGGGPRQAAPQPRGQPGITEGRGGRGGVQSAPQARERSPGASATEGRGGGGAARAAPQGGRGGGPGAASTEGRGGRGAR